MKKYGALILLLGWVALVLFLSFQGGQETAETSRHFTEWVLEWVTRQVPDWQTAALWDNRFRFAAHFVLFFLYGIISIPALAVLVKRKGMAVLLSAGSGIALAVFSETGKLFIPERHCSLAETLVNIAGVLAGMILAAGIRALWRYLADKCLLHSK